MAGVTALTCDPTFNVRPGSKVITSPVTYIATSNALVTTGFEPVYVDIDLKSFALLPEKIEEHLENVEDCENYSLVLPVHLMGYPCDMDAINSIAKRFGLQTFEDSAQAHGTLYKGRKTGSLSLLSDFSFYIAHNIQAGEMGAITTDNKELAKLIRRIKANGRLCDCFVCTRSQGICPRLGRIHDDDEDFDPRFVHDKIGFNFKTMEFQAALAIGQLRKADWIFERRQQNVRYLNENLQKFSSLLQLPLHSGDVSYLAYPIVVRKPDVISRKMLRTELEKNGIETRPLFGCIPTQQPAYAHLKQKYEGKLPNAEYVGKHAFYIACHQYLEQEDLEHIVHSFNKVLGDLT